MKAVIIILVAIITILIIITFGSNKKTFSPRIMANPDGTYSVEYYWPHPGYKPDPDTHRVSFDDAMKAAKDWAEISDVAEIPVVDSEK